MLTGRTLDVSTEIIKPCILHIDAGRAYSDVTINIFLHALLFRCQGSKNFNITRNGLALRSRALRGSTTNPLHFFFLSPQAPAFDASTVSDIQCPSIHSINWNIFKGCRQFLKVWTLLSVVSGERSDRFNGRVRGFPRFHPLPRVDLCNSPEVLSDKCRHLINLLICHLHNSTL